jgi:putative transposase
MEIENSASCGSGGVGQIGKGKASAGYIRGFSDLDVYQEAYRGMLKHLLIDIIDTNVHDLLRQIAEEKRIKLLASGSLPDHMHLLIGLEEPQDLAWAVKQFKGISSRKIFQEFKRLKQDFRINNFWARRYGAKEIPLIQKTNAGGIQKINVGAPFSGLLPSFQKYFN